MKLLDKLEHERVNKIGPFLILKENELRNTMVPPQTPPPPPIVNSPNQASPIVTSIEE